MLTASIPPISELPVHCTACAQRVTLLFAPHARVTNVYECPHCAAVVDVSVPGVVIDWWAGHEDVDFPWSRPFSPDEILSLQLSAQVR